MHQFRDVTDESASLASNALCLPFESLIYPDDYCVTEKSSYLSLHENLIFAFEKGVIQQSDIVVMNNKHYIDIQIKTDCPCSGVLR